RAAGKGEGNAAFFRLACALAAAGVDRTEAQQILQSEANFARSPSERRGEIRSLMRRYDMLSRGRPRAA
ncbi:MAG: primase C-terminal domain-containing protein, partial [Acetobacteraceae bacterium]|nr:primase C-terminal domain-containing protein [Acetobacteraceae bacterium]